MTMMGDAALREALETGGIALDPPPDEIKAASVDLRLGPEAFLGTGTDGRLHDARHTAATVLLLLGVPERVVMGIMGWANSAMAARYQHITAGIRRDVAQRVGGLLWDPVVVEPGADEEPK